MNLLWSAAGHIGPWSFSVSATFKNKISWIEPQFWIMPPLGRDMVLRITQVAAASKTPRTTEMTHFFGSCHSTDWPKFIRCMVICHSNSCQISKECKENYQVSPYAFIQNNHTCDQLNLQMQTQSYLILDICLHSVKDLLSNLDGVNDW